MNIPEFPCRDCGVNTVPIAGNREYYEVHDSVWAEAGAPGIGQSDNGVFGFYLCIGCLEKRLDRELTRADFKPYPANEPSPWLSVRLNRRLGDHGGKWAIESWARTPQFYPNALNPAIVEVYGPYKYDTSPTGAASIGITKRERGTHAK